MHDIITQRLAQCKQQLEQAYAAHIQAEQQVVTLRTEIVGLQRTIQELEALTQHVVLALPEESASG